MARRHARLWWSMSWTPISDKLRRLDPRELAVGRVTPGPILDRHGRVVLEKGACFEAAHASIFELHGIDGLFVGPEWQRAQFAGDAAFSTAAPEELVRSLQRRTATRAQAGQSRTQERHAWSVSLRIVAVIRLEGAVTRRPLTVTTHDVSRTGFSFTAKLYLYEGTEVFAAFDALPGRPIMKGIVRNCHLVAGRDHRIGVEFVPLGSDEVPPL